MQRVTKPGLFRSQHLSSSLRLANALAQCLGKLHLRRYSADRPFYSRPFQRLLHERSSDHASEQTSAEASSRKKSPPLPVARRSGRLCKRDARAGTPATAAIDWISVASIPIADSAASTG